MATRSTKATKIKRVNKVYDLIIKGYSRADILQYATKNKWNVIDRAVDEYIAEATELFKKHGAVDREEMTGIALLRLTHIVKENIEAKDYRTAIAAMKEIHAISGIYAATEINVNYKQLEELLDLAKRHGVSASDLFNAMIAELSMVDESANE